MKFSKLALASSFALLFASSIAHSAAVDLTGWSAEGGGSSWNVQPGNDTVLQTVNGSPTIFFDPSVTSTQGTALSGKISVQTGGDDDFIGFVLGYDSGEIFSASADYYLVDWKQGDQTFTGFGPKGLAISHVTDGRSESSFWNHGSSVLPAVDEIQRGTNLGDTGWIDFQEYDFAIVFTSTLIEVRVDGALEISITPGDVPGVASFDDGSFGFYNYSQANVLYSSIVQVDCTQTPNDPSCQTSGDPTVPEPGTLILLGLGILGLGKFSRRKA